MSINESDDNVEDNEGIWLNNSNIPGPLYFVFSIAFILLIYMLFLHNNNPNGWIHTDYCSIF